MDSKDLRIVLNHELKSKLIKHHLDSANIFYKTGIRQIMTDTFEIKTSVMNKRAATVEDQKIEKVSVDVEITHVMLKKPEYHLFKSGKAMMLTPKIARNHDLTYSSPLRINAKITAVAHNKDGSTTEKTDTVKDLRISGIPTMIRSELCNTHGLSKSALKDLGEDPTDVGGYFIVKGIEWVIDNLESVTFNELHAYRNIGHKNEVARGEFISKPGDQFENSSQIIILRLTDGRLVCKMVVQRLHRDGKELEIPFYAIFRALGMTSDREMIQHIILSENGDISQRMQDILETAMRVNYDSLDRAKHIYNQNDMLVYFGENMDTFDNQYGEGKVLHGDEFTRENKQKHIVNTILGLLDKTFLPHIGMSHEHRHRKLRFFGHLIHKLLLVEMEVVQSTDRDSYATKRIHPTGVSYSKVFKKQFNMAVVQPIKSQLNREIKIPNFRT